jgi:predicted kinase
VATPTPRVHLLCGLPAAGKSTYARRLAAELPAVRFTLDEWMIRLYGLSYDDPAYPVRSEACQALIWDVAVQILGVGRDVVLDWNQWSRECRTTWRDRASELGYQVLLHQLDVPIEKAIAQALARTPETDRTTSHVIDAAGVRHLAAIFEAPSADEGIPIYVVRPDG